MEEDPTVFAAGAEAPRATLLPCASREEALEGSFTDQGSSRVLHNRLSEASDAHNKPRCNG